MERERENAIYLKLFWGANRKTWNWWSRKTQSIVLILLIFCFIAIFCVISSWINLLIFSGVSFSKDKFETVEAPKVEEFPLRCTKGNETQICPRDYPTSHNPSRSSNTTCPAYFRWIHEDLRPWRESGITKEMVERARKTAHFRVVILNGKLLRRYPGRLPDLDLMFDSDDRPVIPSKDFQGPNSGPPTLFRYCADEHSLDIVFPDWSFWGWPEINIRPWKEVLNDIKEGSKRRKWKDRVPYAYWKGNPFVAVTRVDLLKCNVSKENDWNSRLYIQNWIEESEQEFKKSNLEDQCTHRYKIYIEGWAWSVSEKYILACNSMTLYVKSKFYDFFSRSMVPLQHYWPIRDNSKCTSLKFAVEWGNNHAEKAQAIGEAGSNFTQEDLSMEHVYDYMFHLLNEYAKLLRFKPTIPPTAVELCPETMACATNGRWRRFMEDSMVKFPSDSTPCNLPSPFDPITLRDIQEKKTNAIRQVEIWENEYWQNINKTKDNSMA
ncbi:hypothetical protein L6164_021101 [Bauhinia variegata]|uniref:Uncharacterized protein n=1 Tax=Bauhinia variegata TaxID=167791 RepID=A0ACB9MXX3_BAUVA|nr:hypothetical protein L6164_021101 [Bauhinia variegata]